MCKNLLKLAARVQWALLLALVVVTTHWTATRLCAQTLGGDAASSAASTQWNARQQAAGPGEGALYSATDQRYAAPAASPSTRQQLQSAGYGQVQGGPHGGAVLTAGAAAMSGAQSQPLQQPQYAARPADRVATNYDGQTRWDVAQRDDSAQADSSATKGTDVNWVNNSDVVQRLSNGMEKMELTVSSSRILTIDGRFSRAQVNNPEVLSVTPLSPNELQISAVKPGVTQVHLWDDTKRVYSVDVVVYGDVQELQMALEDQYPYSSIRVYRYSNSLVLSGYVDRPDYVSSIVRLAEDYAPKVINNMKVGGVQQILLNVQVMEVSRTKLRDMGFDFANINGNDFVISSISGLLSVAATQTGTATGSGDTVRFGVVDGSNSFFGFLKLLRQNSLAKILAEPKLVTVSGRPASFNVGGEIPVPVPQSLGTVTIQYKKYGTQVDFLPIVLGNGNIRLEVRPKISELDYANSVQVGQTIVPGLKERMIDTGVEMKAGQTLALAGLVQNRIESTNRGIPVLADMPWLGAAFRSVHHQNNEVELLIMVRPELVQGMDPHEVPPGGPGLNTVDPCDTDLYWRGHLEVPRCTGGNGGTDGNCKECNGRQSSQTLTPPSAPMQNLPMNGSGVPQPDSHPDPYANRPVESRFGAAPVNKTQKPNYVPTQASSSKPVYVRPAEKSPAGGSLYGSQQRVDSASNQNNPSTPRYRYEPVRTVPQGTSTNTPGMIGPLGYDVVK